VSDDKQMKTARKWFSQRDFAFLLGGAAALLILQGVIGQMNSSAANSAPRVAGQAVPNEQFSIDFGRRYNVVVATYGSQSRTYENVKILGYTGKQSAESGVKLPSGGGYFEKWLVAELADARRVYFPLNPISHLEEVAPSK
jgi:hypothetical protein